MPIVLDDDDYPPYNKTMLETAEMRLSLRAKQRELQQRQDKAVVIIAGLVAGCLIATLLVIYRVF